MPFMNTGSDQIFYRDIAGPADDSPVFVWAHGFLLSGAFYEAFVTHFPDFRHILVDHRGHGQSSSIATEGRLARMADDILAVAAGLEISRFIYVGHSMGAAIGWRVAAKAPKAVLAGVSIAGIPVIGKLAESHPWLMTMIDMAGDRAAMTDMITPLYIHPETREGAMAAGQSGAEVPRSIVEDIVTDQFHLDESEQLVPLLTQPWLFIVPSEDAAEPAWYQIENAQRLSDTRTAILEGEGHLVPQERPGLVASEIRSFIDAVRR